MPGQSTTLGFSLLGNDGNNVFNVAISGEIKEGANTIYTFPEKRYEFSDVSLDYTFPREGIYKIIYHANVAGDDTPVVADFDVFVGNSSTDANWLIISIGIASITGIIFWLKRKKTKDQKIKEGIT